MQNDAKSEAGCRLGDGDGPEGGGKVLGEKEKEREKSFPLFSKQNVEKNTCL